MRSTILSLRSLLCAIMAFGTMQAQAELPQTLIFGSMYTKNGPGSSFQIAFHTAVALAIKEINDAGGIQGHQIKLVIADDHGDPTQAVNEASRLVQNEKINVLLGPYNTTFNLALAPMLTREKIPQMVLSGSSAYSPDKAPYGFSAYVPGDLYFQVMLDYAVKKFGAKSAVAILDNGANAKQTLKDVMAYAPKVGIKILASEEHDLGATDVTAQLLRLRRLNADVLLEIHSSGSDTGYVLKNLGEIGWNPVILGATLGNSAGAIMKVAGPDVYKSGNRIGNTFSAFTYCPGDAEGGSPLTRMMDRFKKFSPEVFANLNTGLVPNVYDGVYVMKAAIEATRSVDGPTVAAWIEKNGASIKSMITGSVVATKTDHFLFGKDAVGLTARPDLKRADGMVPGLLCGK